MFLMESSEREKKGSIERESEIFDDSSRVEWRTERMEVYDK